MATVYLHIGLPKTGTTALQHFLNDNQEVLHQHNICFPDLGFRYANKGVLRNGHFLIAGWEKGPDGSMFVNPSPNYKKGLDQVAELAETYDKIILSEETLWRGGTTHENFWVNLKEDLASRNLKPALIVYLRRQDLWVQSFWQQKIKTGTCESFYDHLDVMEKNHYPTNYYKYLSYLISIFGKDSVFIRVYEKGQFLGSEGTIFSDFLDVFNLSMADGFEIKRNTYNQSVTGGYLEIRRLLNFAEPFDKTPSVIKLETRRLIEKEEALDPKNSKRSWFRSPEDQQAYLDKFRESNAKVASELLGRPEGILFHDPLQPLPPYQIDDARVLVDTIRVYGQAIRRLDERNRSLKKEVELLKEQVQELSKTVNTPGTLERITRKINRTLKKI